VAPNVWRSGSVLATTVHGLLEHPHVLERLCGVRPKPVLEPTFELLADAVEEHLDVDLLWRAVGG
jgi:adenosylcobyric acid synthase